MRPKISERSIGSMEMPAVSKMRSEKRTVLKAAGRAPMAPMRRFFRPLTMRQTAENHTRSALNSGEVKVSVCSVVSGVGECHTASDWLQALILPQKLSAAGGDGHGVGAVGRSLHQHRAPSARRGGWRHYAAFFAEVGQW